MKYPSLVRSVLFAGLMVALLPAAESASEAGFVTLFNGRDLTGWHHLEGPALDGLTDAGDGRYTVVDGVLTGNDARATHGRVLLWTNRAYPGNFVLRFEFRAAARTDGGLFFNKTQIQCGDYSSYAFKEFAAYRPLDWNVMEVTVTDGVARCTCNGEVLVASLPIAEPGMIGFESDKGAIEYRGIRIRELP